MIAFGLVSLAADMIYEGARSVYGPLLAMLGAGATVVGLVTGAGEAIALILRLFTGTWADRTGGYWSITIAGYALTAVSVPLLAVTPYLGAAGLAVAIALILVERAGKAVRSPAKSALLAEVATEVGRGRGFGVHKALDQTGAFVGPLLVAAVIAATGHIAAAMLALAVPGVITMVLLVVTRNHVPQPEPAPRTEQAAPAGSGVRGWLRRAVGAELPRQFFVYAVAASITTGGLVTFGVISYHIVADQLLRTAGVPVVYACAMGVEALAALATGWIYDRAGGGVLLGLPLIVAVVPFLAFSPRLGVVLAGIALWGAALGVQDSTVKALVAEIVAPRQRATAYGVFAAIQGLLATVGGLAVGWAYDHARGWLAPGVALTQVIALVLFAGTVRRQRADQRDA